MRSSDGACRIEQRRALGDIGLVEQAGERHRDEISIADEHFAVGIGKPLRFEEQVPGGEVFGAERRQVEALELLEDGDHRQRLEGDERDDGDQPDLQGPSPSVRSQIAGHPRHGTTSSVLEVKVGARLR